MKMATRSLPDQEIFDSVYDAEKKNQKDLQKKVTFADDDEYKPLTFVERMMLNIESKKKQAEQEEDAKIQEMFEDDQISPEESKADAEFRYYRMGTLRPPHVSDWAMNVMNSAENTDNVAFSIHPPKLNPNPIKFDPHPVADVAVTQMQKNSIIPTWRQMIHFHRNVVQKRNENEPENILVLRANRGRSVGYLSPLMPSNSVFYLTDPDTQDQLETAFKNFKSTKGSTVKIIKDFTFRKNKIKYDYIFAPYSLNDHEGGSLLQGERLRSAFDHLKDNGMLFGSYANANEAYKMQGKLPGFEVVETNARGVQSIQDANSEADLFYHHGVITARHWGSPLVLDFYPRFLNFEKPWLQMLDHKAVLTTMVKATYQKIAAVIKKPLFCHLDPSLSDPSNALFVEVKDPAIRSDIIASSDLPLPLTRENMYTYVNPSDAVFLQKVDGVPLMLLVKPKRAYIYFEDRLFMAEKTTRMDSCDTVIIQYERVDSVSVLRHVNVVRLGNLDLPMSFIQKQEVLSTRAEMRPLRDFEPIINGDLCFQDDLPIDGFILVPKYSNGVQFTTTSQATGQKVKSSISFKILFKPEVDLHGATYDLNNGQKRMREGKHNDTVRQDALVNHPSMGEIILFSKVTLQDLNSLETRPSVTVNNTRIEIPNLKTASSSGYANRMMAGLNSKQDLLSLQSGYVWLNEEDPANLVAIDIAYKKFLEENRDKRSALDVEITEGIPKTRAQMLEELEDSNHENLEQDDDAETQSLSHSHENPNLDIEQPVTRKIDYVEQIWNTTRNCALPS